MRHVMALVALMAGAGVGLLPVPSAEAASWVRREFNGTTYQDMTWDPVNQRWQGSQPFCLIGIGWLHPDGCEAALGWVAPSTGTVTIQGHIERPAIQGDGTEARIVLNGVQIWPSAGPQEVSPRFMVQHSVRADVQAGDIIYFHVGQNVTLDYDYTRWSPTVTYGFPPKYLTDGAKVVMDPTAMAGVGMTFIDDPVVTLGNLGSNGNTWLHSWETHQIFSGPLDAPATTSIPPMHRTDADLFPGLTLDQGHVWFSNIYRHTDGSYLAFLHTERARRPSTGTHDGMRISIAHSTNPTVTWTYLGHIISPFQDPSQTSPPEGPGFNIFGAPYLVKDGWFYVYYTDWPWRGAVARARVDDVMAAASQGQTTPWTKYHNQQWTQPGLGGQAADLQLPSFFLSSDAALNKAQNTYMLTGFKTLEPQRGVWIAFSQDGVTWHSASGLQEGYAGNCAQNGFSCTLSPHITIVAEDGTDNSLVGDSFWVYWAFSRNWSDWPGPGPEPFGLKWLWRQRVTLTGY